MKSVVGETGETRENLTQTSYTTKPKWSDRDAKSGPQGWEACATRPPVSDLKSNIYRNKSLKITV